MSPADLDSAALRRLLAPAVAEAAAFDGWSARALTAAAQRRGIDPSLALFAFESVEQGPLAMALITAWIAQMDAAMHAAFTAEALAGLPVRTRIRRLVWFRLEALGGHEEALRRALAVMAMPMNAPRAARLGWQAADAMWRLAGDTATDYNHYTKRAILAGVYAAALSVFAADTSPGKADTAAFLDRRIDGVVRFERAKAKFTAARAQPPFSVTRFLGRLRYPQH